MNILILTDRYPPFSTGGYDIGCREIAEGLKSRGHEVSVVTTKYGLTGKHDPESGVYRILGYSDPAKLKSPWTYLGTQARRALVYRSNARIVKRALARIKPDIVYAFQLWDIGLLSVKAIQERGFKIVFDIQDYWLSGYKDKLALRPQKWLRPAAAILNGIYNFDKLDFRYLYVISHTLKHAYARAGFPGEIKVIPRGVRPEDSKNPVAPKKVLQLPVKLLYAGRLVAEKGPDVAVQVLGELAKKSVEARLTFFGEGTEGYLDYLKSIAYRCGVGGQVKFSGKLSRQDMLAEYKNYDILLFPSLWDEPFGVTIIEAISRGLVVIASAKAGPAEIIQDKQTGFLAEPGNYREIARIVRDLLANPSLYDQVRAAGYRAIAEKYDLTREMEQVHNYLVAAAGPQSKR